jgi:hypothetical protein
VFVEICTNAEKHKGANYFSWKIMAGCTETLIHVIRLVKEMFRGEKCIRRKGNSTAKGTETQTEREMKEGSEGHRTKAYNSIEVHK